MSTLEAKKWILIFIQYSTRGRTNGATRRTFSFMKLDYFSCYNDKGMIWVKVPQRIQYKRYTDIQQWYQSDHLERLKCQQHHINSTVCHTKKIKPLSLFNITMDPELDDHGCCIIDETLSYLSERLTLQ